MAVHKKSFITKCHPLTNLCILNDKCSSYQSRVRRKQLNFPQITLWLLTRGAIDGAYNHIYSYINVNAFHNSSLNKMHEAKCRQSKVYVIYPLESMNDMSECTQLKLEQISLIKLMVPLMFKHFLSNE